ncbi:MAG: hypothetical protein IJ719_22830 [Clostridia bacterium]|nr:hypothetical protein [Clostridia bacterium]
MSSKEERSGLLFVLKKKAIQRIAAIGLLFVTFLMLFLPTSGRPDAWYCCTFWLLCGAILIWNADKMTLFFRNTTNNAISRSNKQKYILVSIILSVYHLFVLSGGNFDYLFSDSSWTGIPAKIKLGTLLSCIIVIAVILLMTILVTYVFLWDYSSLNEGIGIHRCVNRAFGLITLVSAVFMFSTYPGWSYPDYLSVWNGVHAGSWSEWHTIGYMLFVKMAIFLRDNQFMVSVLQTACWLAVNYKALKEVESSGGERGVRVYLVLSLVILTPYIYLQAMVKDTIFSICLFGLCVGSHAIISKTKSSVGEWLFLLLSGLGVSLFRHGGLVISLGALLTDLIIYIHFKRKQWIIHSLVLIIIGFLYYLIVVVLGRGVLRAERNPAYVKYSVPFYMMGELAADETVRLDREDVEWMESFAPMEAWRNAHSKYYADPVSREWGILGAEIRSRKEEEYGPRLIAFNWKYLRRFPKQYLNHYRNIISILYEISRPIDGYEWGPIENMAVDYEQGISGAVPNGFTRFTRPLANLTGAIPVIRTILWRGGFYQFCYILLFCRLIIQKKKRLVVGILPVVIYHASLYLSIPAQDPRYILGMIEVFPFFSVIALTATESVCSVSG